MTKSRGNIKENILEKYSEFCVEFSNDDNAVYVSGMDQDGFWIEIDSHFDLTSPEDFAYGYVSTLQKMGFHAYHENLDEYESSSDDDLEDEEEDNLDEID